MGATSWHYYAAYRSDPEAALQALRDEVFARGEYADATGQLEDTLRQSAKRLGHDEDSPEARTILDDASRLQRALQTGDTHGLGRAERALVQRVRAMGELAAQLGAASPAYVAGPPDSIDELLERVAECGTHTVLDIEHVATKSGFAVATPMTAAAVRRVFGVPEPTHAHIEEHWSDLAEGLGRWQAIYVVVYRDGLRDEYAFIGCSGD